MGLVHAPAVKVQTAPLLQQCRNNQDAQQPYPCRFFYVVGVLTPFLVQELNTNTGERIGSGRFRNRVLDEMRSWRLLVLDA